MRNAVTGERNNIAVRLGRSQIVEALHRFCLSVRIGYVEDDDYENETRACIAAPRREMAHAGDHRVPRPTGTTLAEQLVRYRTSLGLLQKEAARKIGVDQGTLARWERI